MWMSSILSYEAPRDFPLPTHASEKTGKSSFSWLKTHAEMGLLRQGGNADQPVSTMI